MSGYSQLSLINHGNWEKCLKTAGKRISILSSKRARRKTHESTKPVSFTLIPTKMKDEITWEIISRHVNDKKITSTISKCLYNVMHFSSL